MDDTNLLSLFINDDFYLVPEPGVKSFQNNDTKSTAVFLGKKEINRLEFFGEFKKQLLILVEDNENPWLSDSNKEFLGNILKAIGYTYVDIALLNLGNPAIKCLKVNFRSLSDYFNFSNLIIFGDLFNQIGDVLNLQKYNSYSKKGQTILIADRLDEIINEIEKKKKLWESLQAMFSFKKP